MSLMTWDLILYSNVNVSCFFSLVAGKHRSTESNFKLLQETPHVNDFTIISIKRGLLW